VESNYWARAQHRLVSRRLLATTGVAGAGLAAAGLVGCGDDDEDAPSASTQPGAATKPPQRGGTYRTGAIGYPTTFNPQLSGAGAIRTRAASRLFVSEMGPGVPVVTSRVVPDAISSFETPDPLTFIVKMHPKVKFGAPVNRIANAADVVYSFDRYTGGIAGVTASPEAGETKRIFDSWTAVDPQTVRFKLKNPQANVAYRLGSTYTPYIMPVEADKAYDPNKVAVGTGAWFLDKTVTGSQLTFKRNPDWHGGPDRPYLDSVEEYTVGDATVNLTQFLGGSLDRLPYVPGNDIERIRSTIKGVQFSLLALGDPVHMSGLAFSGKDTNPPWRDPRVRQAVSMALDRDSMTEAAYEIGKLKRLGIDTKVEWNGFIPVAMGDYWLDPKREGPNKMDQNSARFFKYDPEGAKKLLAEAGFPNGFSGAKLHYPGIFGAGYNTLAELTVQFLSKVGINLVLTLDDYQGVYVPRTRQGNYDGMAFIPYGTYLDPGEVLTGMYLKGGNRNNSVLSGLIDDPDLERKVNAIETNLVAESRKKAILDLQNELALKMYYVPMQAGAANTVVAYQPYMRNVLEYASRAAGESESYFWIDK